MGAITRMNLSKVINKIARKDIKDATLVIEIKGGQTYITKNTQNIDVLIIDIDAAESSNFLSSELDYDLCHEEGFIRFQQE